MTYEKCDRCGRMHADDQYVLISGSNAERWRVCVSCRDIIREAVRAIVNGKDGQ